MRDGLRRGDTLAYVRTALGYEVDFLATRYDGVQTLIQVCVDISDAATFEREVRALQAAQLEFPAAQCLLITLEAPTRDTPIEGIRTVLAAEWLLGG